MDARIDTIRAGRARMARRCAGPRSAAAGAVAARTRVRRSEKERLPLDLGKQFIRWGKADILNPTDRFAPRDFLEVTDDEFLAVIGARGQYERGAHSIDVVWVPDVHAEPHAADRTAAGRRCRRRRSARPGSSIWAPRFRTARSTARAGMCSDQDSSSRSRISTASITCRSSRRMPLSEPAARRASAHLRAAAHGAARTRRSRSAGSR